MDDGPAVTAFNRIELTHFISPHIIGTLAEPHPKSRPRAIIKNRSGGFEKCHGYVVGFLRRVMFRNATY